jgi:FkbM family methyltransferase
MALMDLLNNLFFKLKRKILSKTIYKNNFKTPDFFKYYFLQEKKKFIVQVGGNDGLQNDPLRQFLVNKGNYSTIIFEPIKYYYDQLCDLYTNREDIKLENFYVSNENLNKKIYYLNPKICNELNGEGFFDNWAHGLGSFDKDSILKAIDDNSFRGKNYINNIKRFKENIIHEPVKSFQLKNIKFPANTSNLLVIDVQGFELEVLESLSFKEKIDYIVYEDDKPLSIKSKKIRNLLVKNRYKLIGRLTWLDQIYFKKYEF